jgi:hypothetical protein
VVSGSNENRNTSSCSYKVTHVALQQQKQEKSVSDDPERLMMHAWKEADRSDVPLLMVSLDDWQMYLLSEKELLHSSSSSSDNNERVIMAIRCAACQIVMDYNTPTRRLNGNQDRVNKLAIINHDRVNKSMAIIM